MLWNDQILNGLASSLDVSALRQKVTANNLANLNTPGYKRSYVTFSEEMLKAKKRMPLAQTNPGHMPGEPGLPGPNVRTEQHTSRRSDGNNVDIDEEMLDMVTNQLRYNALVQQVGDRYSQWRYIINEGRR